MKKGIIWGLVSLLLVTSMVLASCSKTTTTTQATSANSTTTTTSSATTTTTAKQTTTTSTTSQTTVTIPPSTTTATTSNATHWWDSMGTPTYGGTLNYRSKTNFTVWDTYLSTNGTAGYQPVLTQFFIGNYATDPKVWDFSIGWLPSQYASGLMLTGWEMPNAYTVVCHIRQDITWQATAPANGRQFTSADVVYHYSRMLGFNGWPKDPYYATVAAWAPLISVVANDKFTVTFNWTPGTSPVSILTIMQAGGADNCFELSEAITANTTTATPYLTSWKNVVGTGPYMISDFVDSSSATYVKNPNFWGKDLRYGMQLPYLDGFKVLIIPNDATAEAAFRVGKIDAFQAMPVQDALAMIKSNPEIIVKQKPQGNEYTLDPRNDVKPFTDLNVRIAMQHAIDIPTIASQYYQGYATPWPASLTENQMGLGGWGVAYPNWPDSTKAQYTYDPTLAKKMLADAGFPNGFNTNLLLENDGDLDLYSIVKSELAAVGINMTIQTTDPASWQSQVLTSKKYDQMAARNQGLMGFNFDIFRQFMRYGVPGYQTNYINVNDPVPQKAYNDAVAAQSIDQVQKLLQDLNLYIATQHYVISLAQPSQFNMVQPWVKGNPGANTLGSAVFGGGFMDGVPLGVWLDLKMKASLGH